MGIVAVFWPEDEVEEDYLTKKQEEELKFRKQFLLENVSIWESVRFLIRLHIEIDRISVSELISRYTQTHTCGHYIVLVIQTIVPASEVNLD